MSGERLTSAPITTWLWYVPADETFPRLGWPEAVTRCPGGGPLAGSSFPIPGPRPSSPRGAQDRGEPQSRWCKCLDHVYPLAPNNFGDLFLEGMSLDYFLPG